MEEVRGGPTGPFEDLEVIRVGSGMPTTRWCEKFGIPERTWRRWQARAKRQRPARGPWPQPARRSVRELVLKHAVGHPAWGHRKIWAMVRHDGCLVSRLNNLRAIAEHHRYVAAKELDQYEAVFCRSGEDEVPMNAPPVDWYPEPVELPEPEEIQRRAAAEARAAWAESDDRVAAAVASTVVYRGEQAAERSRRLLQDVTRDDAESRRLLAAVRGDEPADSPSER